MAIYILTKEYEDGSDFLVCGATMSEIVARVWLVSSEDCEPCGRVYKGELDGEICGTGWSQWQ